MVPVHAQCVSSISQHGHAGKTVASADFISHGRNKLREIGNAAVLAWLS
ncbi:hypothetical protein QF031_002215 [Pseudarthrobacter defluvii]|nr:hypothetical protein [Pseudarthrobacter defluvii]